MATASALRAFFAAVWVDGMIFSQRVSRAASGTRSGP